jgi:hypothetical protein
MQKYIKHSSSLDLKTIERGKRLAQNLGLSFSSLIRFLINRESIDITTDEDLSQEKPCAR